MGLVLRMSTVQTEPSEFAARLREVVGLATLRFHVCFQCGSQPFMLGNVQQMYLANVYFLGSMLIEGTQFLLHGNFGNTWVRGAICSPRAALVVSCSPTVPCGICPAGNPFYQKLPSQGTFSN